MPDGQTIPELEVENTEGLLRAAAEVLRAARWCVIPPPPLRTAAPKGRQIEFRNSEWQALLREQLTTVKRLEAACRELELNTSSEHRLNELEQLKSEYVRLDGLSQKAETEIILGVTAALRARC